ncbi:hypothetical protein CAL7716_104220 (plasmid) [Calothrix sp. PCC 7716]|nr:hypothetical protein CAL7716_104220 [Calothrix sp. PCC 7716]
MPQDFNTIDINNLKVVLDSGLIFDVVRETDGSNGNNGGENNGGVSVPEPSFSLAMLAFGSFGLLSRRNKKRPSRTAM